MGYGTGYYDFDYVMSGLHPPDLITLASRPGVGKTSLALNLATNVAKLNDLPVFVFSLEQTKSQIAQRLILAESKVNGHRLKTGFFSERDWPPMVEAIGTLASSPLYLFSSTHLGTELIDETVQEIKARQGKEVGLIVIDSVHQLGWGHKRREDEIVMELKDLAVQLNAPVLVTATPTHWLERRLDKRPHLSDFGEWDALASLSDIVLGLYRDDYYNPDTKNKGLTELLILKHRTGPVGLVGLFFEKEFARFTNLTSSHQE